MQSGWLEQGMGKERKTAEETGGGGVSRRDFLHTGLVTGVAAAGVAASGGVLAGSQVAQAQQAAGGQDTPIGPKWWPSRWGPQDEAGASNWITPEKVLRIHTPAVVRSMLNSTDSAPSQPRTGPRWVRHVRSHATW